MGFCNKKGGLLVVMGVHFWEASLLKGPKGGHPPKIQFFSYILLVNTYLGILKKFQQNWNTLSGSCEASKW